MKTWLKGVAIAAVHVGLVGSLGAKLLYDRATQPRVWARSAPYDPSLPIRGRYVSLQVVVEPIGLKQPKPGAPWDSSQSMTLHVEGDRLIGRPIPSAAPSDLRIRLIQRQGEQLAVLDRPVAFFIPEDIPDPSLRPAGEELWVEVTIPENGPPRPIRLGVKKGDGPIEPLEHR
jgi:hypothetical protein